MKTENIKVLDKAFAILELAVMSSPEQVTLGEFMRKCDLNKTTCARLIRSLVDKGYLEHAGARAGYRAGVRAQSLGNNMHYDPFFLSIAKPVCVNTAIELRSSATISVMYNNWLYYLIHENHSSLTNMNIHAIAHKSLCNTAGGFVLLAHASEEDQKSAIADMGYPETHNMLMEKCFGGMTFRGLLAKVKKDGFTSFVTPLWGLTAFPVMRNKKCIAALSSVVPIQDVSEESQRHALKVVRLMSQSISDNLEYRMMS